MYKNVELSQVQTFFQRIRPKYDNYTTPSLKEMPPKYFSYFSWDITYFFLFRKTPILGVFRNRRSIISVHNNFHQGWGVWPQPQKCHRKECVSLFCIAGANRRKQLQNMKLIQSDELTQGQRKVSGTVTLFTRESHYYFPGLNTCFQRKEINEQKRNLPLSLVHRLKVPVHSTNS